MLSILKSLARYDFSFVKSEMVYARISLSCRGRTALRQVVTMVTMVQVKAQMTVLVTVMTPVTSGDRSASGAVATVVTVQR
jgi:hypothetical protein